MHKRKISVIGLGYVGLPVAVAFGRKTQIIGFDINQTRIAELQKGHDRTKEVESEELKAAQVLYTTDPQELKKADFHIIAVPTPIDDSHRPDLIPVIKSSETVGKILKKGDIVVYESTVYPGLTEEIAAPILERESGLKSGVDFKLGYSPERINPGDKEKTFTKILKIVSGQDAESLEIVANVYASAVEAGVYRASSIRVAEAAKVIENTQRDLNIALMNELAIIFEKLNLDTREVLAAAGTKWNFIKFFPGLVGGHCIGVDPYYLTHKAEKMGYIPQVILAGRRINDGMGKFVAQKAVKELIHAEQSVLGSRVLLMGLTFKEDCPDTRNSKVPDIITELIDFGIQVDVTDPEADVEEAKHEYDIDLVPWDQVDKKSYNMIIVAVGHQKFTKLPLSFFHKISTSKVMIDVKGIFSGNTFVEQGFRYWRL